MPSGGGRKRWLFSVATSVLLHAPLFFLLPPLPQGDTSFREPGLTLSLHSVPTAGKPASAGPRETAPQPEARPKPKPRPTPPPEKTALRAAEPQGAAGSRAGGAENPPAAESGAAGEDASAGQSPASGAAAGPAEASSLRILKEVLPDYPAFSRKRGEEGRVRVIVTITGGAVTETGIYESSGSRRLDQSALRAAGQWRFAETEELRVIIPFIFSLKEN